MSPYPDAPLSPKQSELLARAVRLRLLHDAIGHALRLWYKDDGARRDSPQMIGAMNDLAHVYEASKKAEAE